MLSSQNPEQFIRFLVFIALFRGKELFIFVEEIIISDQSLSLISKNYLIFKSKLNNFLAP